MLFSTKVRCSVVSIALLCKPPQFYTNLKNLPFAMNEKNGIGESKPKQSRRQGESAPELPIGCSYALEPLAVSQVLKLMNEHCYLCTNDEIQAIMKKITLALRKYSLK